MPLIMAEQKAMLRPAIAAQQQQVTVARLNIKNHQFSCRHRRTRNQEVFTEAVLTHIECEVLGNNPV